MCQWKNPQKDEMQNTCNLLFLMIHFAVRWEQGVGAGVGWGGEEGWREVARWWWRWGHQSETWARSNCPSFRVPLSILLNSKPLTKKDSITQGPYFTLDIQENEI